MLNQYLVAAKVRETFAVSKGPAEAIDTERIHFRKLARGG
jgi:hypothetical protein